MSSLPSIVAEGQYIPWQRGSAHREGDASDLLFGHLETTARKGTPQNGGGATQLFGDIFDLLVHRDSVGRCSHGFEVRGNIRDALKEGVGWTRQGNDAKKDTRLHFFSRPSAKGLKKVLRSNPTSEFCKSINLDR